MPAPPGPSGRSRDRGQRRAPPGQPGTTCGDVRRGAGAGRGPALNLAQAVEAARAALESIDGRPAFRPAVVAHDTWLASGLETMLPETVVMCVQRSSAVDVLRQRGIEIFCLSEHVSSEEVAGRSSADLFEHRLAIEFCLRHGPLAVMTFKPSERFEAAVRSASSRLIAGGGSRHMAVARIFEDEVHFLD